MGSLVAAIRKYTRLRQANGSVLVELAIIVPLILLAVGATVQFGVALRDTIRLTALTSSISKQLSSMPLNSADSATQQKATICAALLDAESSLLNASNQNPAEHTMEVTFFTVASLNREFARISVRRPFGGLTKTLGFQNIIDRHGEAIVMLTSGANLGLDGETC